MTEQLKSPESGAPSGRGLNWSAGLRRLWNRCLKPVLPAAAIALAGQVQGLASDLRFKLEQTGADVVLTLSGRINTSTLLTGGGWATQSGGGSTVAYIIPSVVGFNGSSQSMLRGPWTYTSGGELSLPDLGWTVTSGMDVALLQGMGSGNGNIILSRSYPSGAPLSATATFGNKNLTGSTRSYVWSLPNGDTVTIEIIVPNAAPVATDVADSTNEDTAKQITLAATDADGNTLTYSIVGNPATGTLGTIAGNKVTFTPAANANGVVTFTFKANDGTVDSATKTVTVTVNAVNDAPTLTTPTAIALIDTAIDDSF